MTRSTLVASLSTLAALVLAAGSAPAQLTRLVGPEKEAIIYDGDLQLDSGGINLVSWGSGEAEPVYEETYVGPQTLKVESQGPFQGIVLQLNRPVDLQEFMMARGGYLEARVLPGQPGLQYRRQQQEMLMQQQRAGAGMAGGGRGGGMRGGGGGGMGGRGGGMRGGGGGGMRGGRGAAGGAGAGARMEPVTSEKAFTARNLRLVLFTDKGQLVADAAPIGVLPKDDKGWVPVAASLSAMKGAADATQVRAVGIFSDESEVFYLGRVRLLVDNKPVEVTAKAEPLFTLPGQVVEFEASLRGGLVEPRFSWDFDKRDGLKTEALGPEVKFVFKEPGDYIITCTVTDKTGVQSSSKDEVGVKVEKVEAME